MRFIKERIMTQFQLRGLYAITLESSSSASLLSQVKQALQGGAQLMQYRNKRECDSTVSTQQKTTEAAALLALCHSYQVPLIINDDVALAYALGADGVHLGQHDLSLFLARQTLGPQALIGVSCYNNLELAIAAQAAGASYVAFGSFFPSTTKPQASAASLEILHQARAHLRLPIVAIGGITAVNGGALIQAGADMLAVVGGVFAATDIRVAAQAVTDLFGSKPS